MLLFESNHGDMGVGRNCYLSKKIQEIKVPKAICEVADVKKRCSDWKISKKEPT